MIRTIRVTESNTTDAIDSRILGSSIPGASSIWTLSYLSSASSSDSEFGCCGEVIDSALEVTTVLIVGSGEFIEWPEGRV